MDKTWEQLKRRSNLDHAKKKTAPNIEKIGEKLTPNLRALRLAITASDLLLSMGVPANSVVSRALDITDTYCKRPVHINITLDLITVSQVRGVEYEPLTLVRPAAARPVNNMTVQAVQQLIYEIRTGKHTLKEAEAELERILEKPEGYPRWIPPIANACIAPAVVLMYTTNWRIIAISFIVAFLIDRILVLLTRWSFVSFFRQIAVSCFVTLAAALITWLAGRQITFFTGLNPQVIIIGGIVMLVAGLAAVGAVQDAIDEYYVTASARLLRVIMLTTGIIIGILMGLYITRHLGMRLSFSPQSLHQTALPYRLAAGAVIAAAFSVATHTHRRAILWAAFIGAGALAVLYVCRRFGISSVAASGIAAFLVGLVGQLFSRNWRTPSSGIIADGIVPLVPGLTLFTGLMQLVSYHTGNALFFRGIGTSFTAIGMALAIATGASFGSTIGRPLYRKVTQSRNFRPFANFMKLQIRSDRRRSRIIEPVIIQPDE